MNNDQIKQINWEEIQAEMINDGEDFDIKRILNNKNRKFTENYLCNFIKDKIDIDYKINDLEIFQIAMTHDSYIKKDLNNIKNIKSIFPDGILTNCDNNMRVSSRNDVIPLQDISYEILEWAGDSILGSFLADYILCRYNKFGPGELTETKALIENRKAFSEITKKISLHKYILISKNYEIVHTREGDVKILCDLFESFICALFYDICKIKYSDFGNRPDLMNLNRGLAYQICWTIVVKLIEEELNIPSLFENDTNYKKRLLMEYHKRDWLSPPIYKLIETKTDERQINKKYYKTGVYNNDKNLIGVGTSTSKNTSEKLSAKNALHCLNALENNKEEMEEISKNSNLINFK